MNIFNKVTLNTLKENKVRTVVTIIGVILSAAMICAVTTIASSFLNYLINVARYTNGDWQGSALSVNKSVYEKVKNDDEVESVVYLEEIGYALDENIDNKFKPYIYVMAAGKNANNVLPIHITEGSYPTNDSEILLPEHLRYNGGVYYKVGDVLKLEVGKRFRDGEKLTQSNSLYYEDEESETPVKAAEEFVVDGQKTYTIVGYYERAEFEPYNAPGYTAITVSNGAMKDDASYDIYFSLKNAKDIYDFMKDNGLKGGTNSTLLMALGVSRYDSFYNMVGGLSAIIIGLIMFGSVALIYNAFSISVSERTKQFGLLSSVGATKKQVRKMVFFEALSVSVVGIPLGILSGIGGIGVTLMIIGPKFRSLGFPVDMELSVSWFSIVVAVVVALVTVMISAWLPSKRATKVTAIEAIRQNNDIKIRNKNVKVSKLTAKLFGLPGVLATKYYKRNKKKYTTTVVSLFMSIVLFVTTSAFTSYITDAANVAFETSDYDLEFIANKVQLKNVGKDELLKKIKGAKNITEACYVQYNIYTSDTKKEYLTDDAIRVLEGNPLMVAVYFIDDAAYESMLKDYNLNKAVYMNKENPVAVICDGTVEFDSEKEKYITINSFKNDNVETSIELYSTDEKITIKGGKILYDHPYFMDVYAVSYLYPASFMDVVMPETEDSSGIYYLMKSDNHNESFTSVKNILKELSLSSSNLYDYAAQAESDRNLLTILNVFSYGFITLISLIAAANVFNTISTNISLRRREFAMLKSIGMDNKAFNRMMNFECILYGAKSLILGIPVSVLISYAIHLSIMHGVEMAYKLPISAMLIATASVFLVVFMTMLYSMSKIKKDNPIEALKNENI
ncbi:MAG: ABC transporter permease [Lachnospira sp.]|nr:ABC transporter permease [Lachnospira sp.]